MEGLKDDPDPDMRIHYFSTAIVHELLRELVRVERDDFIQDLPKGTVQEDTRGN